MTTPHPEFPDAFALEELGPHRYRAGSIGDPEVRDVVYGGQLLAQMMLAAGRSLPGKEVKTIHTVFARGATLTKPIELDVEPMHDGRTMASATVSARQGDRLCARSLVLLHADEPDLIRHQVPMPEAPPPEQCPDASGRGLAAPGSEVRIVGGVDTWDPDASVGPAELLVWLRLPGGPAELGPGLAPALLAYATDGFLIGTAMRPHAGYGQHMAHQTVSTGVVSHTLTLHEPVVAGRWMLLAHQSPYAGRGRSYGRADVFEASGALVASFVQDNLVRGTAPDGARGRPAH